MGYSLLHEKLKYAPRFYEPKSSGISRTWSSVDFVNWDEYRNSHLNIRPFSERFGDFGGVGYHSAILHNELKKFEHASSQTKDKKGLETGYNGILSLTRANKKGIASELGLDENSLESLVVKEIMRVRNEFRKARKELAWDGLTL